MKYKQFDYYIFVDFSESLIGYNIIEKDRVKELLLKTSKFKHYKDVRNKKIYLKNIKKTINRQKIESYFLRFGIRKIYKNADVYADILEFISKHNNCIIFISVDNRQFKAFNKLVGFVDGKRVFVKKESELVRGTPEYRMSLILDNMLNIKRIEK